MKRALWTGMGLLLWASLAAGATAGEPSAPRLFDRLLQASHSPLEDARQGRLYEAVTQLLEAGRALPDAIDLGIAPAAAAARSQADQAAAQEPAAALPKTPPRPAQPQWLAVLDRPVVDDEELAYACFQARSYAEAAQLYRALRERNPDDAHLLLMLLLCERNSGNAQNAQGLLAELRQKGPEQAEWADWLTSLAKLNADVSREGK